MRYFANIIDNKVDGYYLDEMHQDTIPTEAIEITEELWQFLIEFSSVQLKENCSIEGKEILTKEELDLFEPQPITSIEDMEIPKTEEEIKIEELEKENKKLSSELEAIKSYLGI